ncbi:MAG TPA: hypothetical protein VJ578_05400 [Dehalococcoidia bacterium]|nr:hypothetical protein [Dehalococcoidia bacterium]
MSGRKLVFLGSTFAGVGVVVLLIVLWPFGSDASSPPSQVRSSPQVTVIPYDGDEQPPRTPSPTPHPTEPVGDDPETPTPQPEGCQPHPGPDPLTDTQLLSYYGNPYTADMGILGELSPETLVQELKAHAQLYDSLNGPRGVQGALHLVYATAQGDPGREGLYLLYVDEETLREYIDLACENGLLVFLDLQIGRSDVPSELTKILPYLEQPHVHVALDPEFAMPQGEVPGESIGSLDAADVNAAQAILQDFLEGGDLPDKILIVHQFTQNMLTNPELIDDLPRVKLVIDMDGFGPSEIKRVKYGWFAAPAEYSGVKLFFRHDTDLMSEQEVLELNPDVIIYQ